MSLQFFRICCYTSTLLLYLLCTSTLNDIKMEMKAEIKHVFYILFQLMIILFQVRHFWQHFAL